MEKLKFYIILSVFIILCIISISGCYTILLTTDNDPVYIQDPQPPIVYPPYYPCADCGHPNPPVTEPPPLIVQPVLTPVVVTGPVIQPHRPGGNQRPHNSQPAQVSQQNSGRKPDDTRRPTR